MRATRRYWAVAALSVAVALLGVVLARPLLLVGAAGLAGFLVATQLSFLRALRTTTAALSIEQATDRDRTVVEGPVSVTLAATVPEGSPVDLTITAGIPAAGSVAADPTISLERHQQHTETTVPVTLPVAGAITFERPTVRASHPLGLLTETLRVGAAPTVIVDPRGPRNVHLGQAGEAIATPFGEHPTGRRGEGLAPTELREYTPGDAASRIDWKATARLDQPFVREDEVSSERATAILIDHRSTMATGPEGETKLDYARQVGLAVTTLARENDDPLGCYAVGDGGLTRSRPPKSSPATYDAIRRALYDLEPTSGPADAATTLTAGPTDGGTAATRLEPDESAYGRTLRPYFSDAAAYVERIDDEPLFAAARVTLGRVRGSLWTVLLTDDSARAQVTEAAKAARRRAGHVAVVLTPTVLFEPGGLADLDEAYDRYREFEGFRQDLDRLDRVTAYELAPGDRLDAVLDTGRRRSEEGRVR